MEILFENCYVRNRALAKEIYRYYYFRRKVVVACNALLLLSFLINLLILIFEHTCNWGIFIFVPLFLVFQIYCYYRQVNLMVKRDDEVHGKEVSVKTIVTNDYIQSTASTGAVIDLKYDKIKNSVQTKNLILLRTRTNLFYIFRKDTFTKGSKDDFIAFLTGKGIKVK